MIVSSRKHFIGFHVTLRVRDQLRNEAKSQGMSVSKFCYKAILEVLGMTDELENPLEELIKHE